MFERAWAREIELEHQGKRKKEEHSQVQPSKKFKGSSQRLEGKKEYPKCSKCSRSHLGECRLGSSTCYKCGKPGHMSRDYKASAKLCFRCFEPSHFAHECPNLVGSTQVSVAALTKAIEASSAKKVEIPKGRARDFQLTAEEAKVEPEVVIGIFPVNSKPALVLFDMGASKSFVSTSFCKSFSIVKGRLDEPLEVEIADDKSVIVRDVYRGNVIELGGVRFRVDLIPIPMREINVVLGMSWLSRHGAWFDCEGQRVRIRNPDGGVLIIAGNGKKRPPKTCSLAKARRYVKGGGVSYLVYVTESAGEKKKKTMADVPVVGDFSDVIPKDLSGVPPERQIEFGIDLVLGAAPTAKAPYQLVPSAMQELLSQLEELLGKRPMLDRSVIVFIDDILIYSKTEEDHVVHLTKVIETLRREQLYTKFCKCDFWLQEVQFLSHHVNREGIKVDPAKVGAVMKLTRKNVKFVWGEEQQEAFKLLRGKLCKALVLTLPEGIEDMTVYCNASYHGLGCVLMQRGKDYDFEILYHPGKANVVADALSRKVHSVVMRVPLMRLTVMTSLLELIKSSAQRPHGKLQPFDIPVWKWEHITMDLITKLPRTPRNVDAIRVIVDRLTKSAHFIAINESSSSEKLVDTYIREIVARHGYL
ncbi:hypothetical protein OSB04_006470 [Centaurea solstitialis]|uniref:CCHC-type domain-containing protein n=1 Tax=Centaurea solstitialis TaxID=347529 RepID=A0AA38TUP2_9ASTR|nr:hypothetical protein OSB04_006470 [Centaurea solstitialis]